MRNKGTWTPENANLSQDDRDAIARRRMSNPNRSSWDRPDDNPTTSEVESYFRDKPARKKSGLDNF